MKHRMKKVRGNQWTINNSKKQDKELTMVKDEFCQEYDSLDGKQDSDLRIVETITVNRTPKDPSIKPKRKSNIPTALFRTNKNLFRTNEILIDIVKMMKMSLKTNNVEEKDGVTKKDLEEKLKQQKQEHLVFVKNMTKVLKTNAEKEKHLHKEITSLKMENEKIRTNMKNNQQNTEQNANDQNCRKQTARKTTIYKDSLKYRNLRLTE